MALTISSAPTTELLSLDEAKRHLRLYSSDLDDDVASKIRAARDICERHTSRTLRGTVTRVIKEDNWWSCELKLPFPPVLAVSSITYYDVANVSQTLATSTYYLELGSDGSGEIEWTYNATIPSLYPREDAVTITYTTGYTDLDSVPPTAVEAMKCGLSELWTDDPGQRRAYRDCLERLLSYVDWTSYA